MTTYFMEFHTIYLYEYAVYACIRACVYAYGNKNNIHRGQRGKKKNINNKKEKKKVERKIEKKSWKRRQKKKSVICICICININQLYTYKCHFQDLLSGNTP